VPAHNAFEGVKGLLFFTVPRSRTEKIAGREKKAGSGGRPLTRPWLYDIAMKRLPVVEVLGRRPSAQFFDCGVYADTYRLFHGRVTVAP
jgi:hypothetical protein